MLIEIKTVQRQPPTGAGRAVSLNVSLGERRRIILISQSAPVTAPLSLVKSLTSLVISNTLTMANILLPEDEMVK